MKNIIYVDLDTDREDNIRIGKPNQEQPETLEELSKAISLDIGTLCEALVVIIRAGGESGAINEMQALENCMKHLQEGFMDDTVKAEIGPDIKITGEDGPFLSNPEN